VCVCVWGGGLGEAAHLKMIMREVCTVTTLLCYSLRRFVQLPFYCLTVYVGLYS